MTVSMSLRWAQRWASAERQWLIVLPIQPSNGCVVTSIQIRTFWKSQYLKWQATCCLPNHRYERQQSVNECCCCILDNRWVVQRHLASVIILVACMGKNCGDYIVTTSKKWASTERQQFLVLHLGKSRGFGMACSHTHSLSHLGEQKCYERYRYYVPKIGVNGVSTIFGIASWKIQRVSLQHYLIIEL